MDNSIPQGWALAPLGNLVDYLGSGISRPFFYGDSGLPVLRSNNVKDGRIVLDDLKYWHRVDPRGTDLKSVMPRDGDILINFVNGSASELGKSAIFRGIPSPCIVSTNFFIVRLRKELVTPDFVSVFLQSGFYRDWLSEVVGFTGQGSFNQKELRRLKIPLPPACEQMGIAAVSETWDRAIRQLTDLIAAKLRFKQGLMQQILTGKLRFKRYRDEWQPIHLRDVITECEERNRGQLGLDSVMAVTKAEGIIPMRERTIGAEIGRYLIVRKNWFAYNPMRINIGSIARWSGDSEIVVSPDYVVFRCKDYSGDGLGMDPGYLDHLRRSGIWEKFVTAAGNGSVRVRIYFSDLGHLKFKLPGLSEQRRIASFLNVADKEIELLLNQLGAVKQQKKGLMQKLLTGELRVRMDHKDKQHV